MILQLDISYYTMSDIAGTEKHFKYLLQEYRNSVLPEIIDTYHQLSEDEKNMVHVWSDEQFLLWTAPLSCNS